jgi:hypothetical protein
VESSRPIRCGRLYYGTVPAGETIPAVADLRPLALVADDKFTVAPHSRVSNPRTVTCTVMSVTGSV